MSQEEKQCPDSDWNTIYQSCCKSRCILLGTGFPSYSILKAAKCYDKIKAATNGSIVHHKLQKLTNTDEYYAGWAGLKRKIHILINNLIHIFWNDKAFESH